MNTKFVAFEAYCEKCKYAELAGWKDPCNECLQVGGRESTREPINYEPKEEED